MPERHPDGTARSAELALAVYLGPLVADCRVLWLTDAVTEAPHRLALRARSVLVLAREPGPRGEREGARVSLLKPGPLSFKPDSFEVIVATDLVAIEMAVPERVAHMREILASDGVLIAGTIANGRGLSYEALYELLAGRFGRTHMLGQAPFAGWSVVDFGASAGQDDLTFDGTLLEDHPEEATRFFAVCSDDATALDPWCVVQIPSARPHESVAADRGSVEDVELAKRVRALEAELARQQAEVEAAADHAETLERSLEQKHVEVEHLRAERARRAPEAEDSPVPGDEYGRLEEALAEAASRLSDLKDDIERRDVLVRDLIEETQALRQEPPVVGSIDATLPFDAIRDGLLIRVVNAETASLQTRFETDELKGRLIDAEVRAAEAEGAFRGLRSRVSELEEMADLAVGRFALAEADLEAALERELRYQREMADLQEQLELELVRARGSGRDEGALSGLSESERESARRVGELTGLLVRCREAALETAAERDHARAETLRLTALLSSSEDRFAGARLGYEARIAELTSDLRETQRVDSGRRLAELLGECDGLRARLEDREAALTAAGDAHARLVGVSAALGLAQDDADRLRQEVERLGEAETELTLRAVDAEELANAQTGRVADLASTVAARDALVVRLEQDVAEGTQQMRRTEQRLHETALEAERLGKALADASGRVDEALEADDRLHGLEERLAQATARAEASRRALGEMRRLLAGLGPELSGEPFSAPAEITAVGMESPGRGAEDASAAAEADARAALESELLLLRTRIATMAKESEDGDTLMRSLTAQLQERNDRILALERRLLPGSDGPAGDEALRQELLELQSRAGRMSEEVHQERRARVEAERRLDAREGDGGVRELHERLGRSDAEQLLLQGHLATAERDLKGLRDACIQARAGLEELLGAATASGDPAAAERIGSVLRLLSRA